MPRLFRYALPVLGVAALTAALVSPGAAFAKGHKGPKTAKPVRVTCTSLSGNAGTGITISGCNEPNVTGGTGTFPGGTLGTSGNATVTWAGGLGTTTFSYSSTVLPSTTKADKCPVDPTSPTAGTKKTEAILHGAVRSNTEANPSTDGGVKAAVTAKLCVDSTLNVTLLPPKPFKL